jgi:hypothetical protein
MQGSENRQARSPAFAGAVTGREPAVATARATETMFLPPSAMMDDCCGISQAPYGAVPLGPAGDAVDDRVSGNYQ